MGTVGAVVTFTATVAGSAPTGTVNFKDSGTTIAGCATVPLAAAGKAACSTSTLVAGVHSIVAAYSGDAANTSSSSAALSQVVNATAQTNGLTNGVAVTGLLARRTRSSVTRWRNLPARRTSASGPLAAAAMPTSL